MARSWPCPILVRVGRCTVEGERLVSRCLLPTGFRLRTLCAERDLVVCRQVSLLTHREQPIIRDAADLCTVGAGQRQVLLLLEAGWAGACSSSVPPLGLTLRNLC